MLNLARNPAAALEKTRASLTASESKIDRLVGERAAKLAESDDLAPVQVLDRAVEAERSAAAIHRDRIAILEAEARRQDWERRERERVEAIEKTLVPRVEKCTALAAELDRALSQFCAAWITLREEGRAIASCWPAAIPKLPNWGHYSSADGEQKILSALRTDAERVSDLARRAGPITPTVERAGANFLERVRGMKIPEPDEGSSTEKAA